MKSSGARRRSVASPKSRTPSAVRSASRTRSRTAGSSLLLDPASESGRQESMRTPPAKIGVSPGAAWYTIGAAAVPESSAARVNVSAMGYVPPWTTTRTPPAGRTPPLPARSFRTASRAPASVARGAASVPSAASSPCGATCSTKAGAGSAGSSTRCSAGRRRATLVPRAWFPSCGDGPRRGSRPVRRHPRQDAARSQGTQRTSSRSGPRPTAPVRGREAGPRRRAQRRRRAS